MASADDQVKMRSAGWALIEYDCCSYTKGKLGHRDRQAQREVEVKTSRKPPTNACSHQKLGERPGHTAPHSHRRKQPYRPLDFRLPASRPGDSKFVLFKPP